MKVCIDPGHGFANVRAGQYDPGAQSAGHSEADITLQWALTLNWVLRQAGIETFLTRDDDRDADPVSTRDDRAEAAGCTHFIAIHCNCADGTATGTEVFYRDAADKRFGNLVMSAAVDALALKDRGLKTEGASQHSRLAIFEFDGPACLVELGFIDNAHDRERLLSRDVRIIFANRLRDWLKSQLAE